jgi:integrase
VSDAHFGYTTQLRPHTLTPMPHRAFHEFEPPPRFLTQDEVARFFAAITEPRDRALFALIYVYGLRLSEALMLRRKDVDLAAGRILIRRSKRGIWGIRPLFSSARALLAAYMEASPSTGDAEGALFQGRQGPLRRRRIQQLFGRYAAAAGLPPGASCHSLRHAIATHLLDAGESMEFVKEHLGHRKIENTAIYARVSNPARERAFARLEKSVAIVHLRPKLLAPFKTRTGREA